jgi:hypothetical protein
VPAASAEDVIGYLRGHRITLTWDPTAEALQAGTPEATKTIIGKAKLTQAKTAPIPEGEGGKTRRSPGARGSCAPGDFPACP